MKTYSDQVVSQTVLTDTVQQLSAQQDQLIKDQTKKIIKWNIVASVTLQVLAVAAILLLV